jgi:predicted PurR-regulated permease PerM
MISLFSKGKKTPSVDLTISNRTVFRVLLATFFTIALFSAVAKASHALSLIGTGLFLALALDTPVHALSERLPGKKKGSRTLATALSFVVIIGLITGFIASIVPPLVTQTSNFIKEAPALVQDVRSENNSVGSFVRRYNLEDQTDKLSAQLSDRLGNITGTAFSTFTKLGGSIFSVLTILVIAFMMLIEGPKWIKYFRDQLPNKHQKHADTIAGDMYAVIRGYVNGQVTLAALAALFILVPLFILDISYPIALMVIVFVCGLIPLVGHTIGAAIVTTVALFHSVPAAIFILIYYITYQQIENYAVQPKIQSNSTNLTPLTVFMSVIVGVSFGGLFAGLIAIPVAGCLRVILVDYMIHRKSTTELA